MNIVEAGKLGEGLHHSGQILARLECAHREEVGLISCQANARFKGCQSNEIIHGPEVL